MWRAAWTQLHELDMCPFIPVFLPTKAQLVGASEAWRHLFISVWSKFPFLWIFLLFFPEIRILPKKEKNQEKRKSSLCCQDDPIPLFWEGPWEQLMEQTHWYSLHQSGIFLLGMGVPIPVSPRLDLQYGEGLKEFFSGNVVHFSYLRLSFQHFQDSLS